MFQKHVNHTVFSCLKKIHVNRNGFSENCQLLPFSVCDFRDDCETIRLMVINRSLFSLKLLVIYISLKIPQIGNQLFSKDCKKYRSKIKENCTIEINVIPGGELWQTLRLTPLWTFQLIRGEKASSTDRPGEENLQQNSCHFNIPKDMSCNLVVSFISELVIICSSSHILLTSSFLFYELKIGLGQMCT